MNQDIFKTKLFHGRRNNNYLSLSSHLLLTFLLFILFPIAALATENGALLATFPETVYFFAKNPGKPEIYASTSHNILIIDPLTQQIAHKIPMWGEPRGLTLSDDGAKLYVASSAAQQIMVIDTKSYKILSSIQLPYMPYDIKFANNGYLYATFGNGTHWGFMQIDTKNDKPIKFFADFPDNSSIYPNSLIEVSPDRKMIYFANLGYSPGSLLKYNVSSDTPSRIYKNEHGSLGSNGVDLHLTSAGDYIYYVVGSGNGIIGYYDIARIQTSDMTVRGVLITGPYPTALTTSSDGKIAYTYNGENLIKVWDTETQQQLCKYSINAKEPITKLTIDQTSAYLIVAFLNSLKIYSTGCPN